MISPPIAQNISARAIEALTMRALHGDAQGHRPISARAHAPEGIRASRADSSFNLGAASEAKASMASNSGRIGLRCRGSELDVTDLFAALRAGAVHAHGKCVERAAALDENQLAGGGQDGANLIAKVEPLIRLVSEFPHSSIACSAWSGRATRAGPALCSSPARGAAGVCFMMAVNIRANTEFLVQAHVLGLCAK